MFAYGFEDLQVSGMQPSLLTNKLRVSQKTLSLMFLKIRLLPDGCWEWMGARRKGYGAIRIRALSAQVMQTHRVCYQLVHGPIDEGLDLHHKTEDGCIGPPCCNPAHLQLVTKGEHIRDLTPDSITYINARKETCPVGHEFTIENTRILKNGFRQCRSCDKLRAQQKRDRLRTRPKFAKDPDKLKTECFRGHSLTDETNIRWVDSLTGKQRVCLACEALRIAGYRTGDKPEALSYGKCKRGHKMTGDNVYIHPDGIRRSCKACRDLNFKKKRWDDDTELERFEIPDFSIEDGEWF